MAAVHCSCVDIGRDFGPSSEYASIPMLPCLMQSRSSSTMPPDRKKPRDGPATEHHQEQNPFPLLNLPEAVLALIAEQLLSSQQGQAMLPVSRVARDTVLRSLTKIKLNSISKQSSAARLLSRACSEASPGVDVELVLGHQEDDQDALHRLLQGAFDSAAGWHKVHKLRVVAPKTACLNLLGPAMPCLKSLTVDLHQVGKYGLEEVLTGWQQLEGLFTGTQACTGLEVLHVSEISISPASVKPSAAILARLPALKDVSLKMSQTCNTDPSGLVQQLTSLTSLHLSSHHDHLSSMFTAAARNPALQAFSVSYWGQESINAAELQHLLTSCTSLTDLDLDLMEVSQDALEVLLTHGTKITSLKALALITETSFADRQCSWRRLKLVGDECYATVLHWADLPLKGVEVLENGVESLGTLQLPLSSVEPDQLATVLRRATTNLAACPAWQAAPDSKIALHEDPAEPHVHPIFFFPQQRIQLLEALAPLGGPHVRTFQASVQDAVFQWGCPELKALARSMNSGQLSTLELSYCTLTTDFWAALDEVLPSLSSLSLVSGVTCSAADVAVYCSKRKEGQPFTLTLGDAVYTAVGGAQLQAALEAQGPVHVRVARHMQPAMF